MKKKLLSLSLIMIFFMTFVSCDLLSTINAVRGFYTEYNEFSALYNDTTQYTVLTETELTISNSTIASMVPVDSRVYFMLDQNSDFFYIEQNLEGEDMVTLYEDTADLYVAYEIDGMVVTPTLPEDGERYTGNTSANMLNDNFSYEDVQNENKIGDRTYSFDVVLTKALDLNALSGFLDQIKVFDEELTKLNDVLAHLVITFDSVDSTIDVTATVEEYTIAFDDTSTVTFSLNNHTVLKIPENFEMPDVFAEPYQMVAVDDVRLARRVYNVDQPIIYPAVSGQSGWVQVYLETGVYELVSDYPSNFVASVVDVNENPVNWNVTDDNSYVLDVNAGTYFVQITPSVDFTTDLVFDLLVAPVPTTTEPITTESTTTVDNAGSVTPQD